MKKVAVMCMLPRPIQWKKKRGLEIGGEVTGQCGESLRGEGV